MPAAALDGAIKAAQEGISVMLVGDEAVLKPELERRGAALDVHHASDVITMEDGAGEVRRRRDSSVVQSMQLVKEGKAKAAVSMGHSGATMAAALLVLGRIKGVERPAIVASIPATKGYTALLDAGANADCKASYLQQFAVMGDVYAQIFFDKAAPTTGLMSIGEEPGKGNELTREAFGLLSSTPGINFYGNVEGRDLLNSVVDVIVTDGFTGNVVLKLAEGEAKTIFGWIRSALKKGGPLIKLGAGFVKPALKAIADRMDPYEYGAQPLLGVDGYAFIGHGSSDARAVRNALQTVERAVAAGLVKSIAAGLRNLDEQQVA